MSSQVKSHIFKRCEFTGCVNSSDIAFCELESHAHTRSGKIRESIVGTCCTDCARFNPAAKAFRRRLWGTADFRNRVRRDIDADLTESDDDLDHGKLCANEICFVDERNPCMCKISTPRRRAKKKTCPGAPRRPSKP